MRPARPATPIRMSSRRVGPSHVWTARPGMFSMMLPLLIDTLVAVKKTLAVEQRPKQILGLSRPRSAGRYLSSRSPARPSRADATMRRGRDPPPVASLFLPARMLVVICPSGRRSASEIVFPLTRFSACGRLRSARRSHSHADSRAAGRKDRESHPCRHAGPAIARPTFLRALPGKSRPGARGLRDRVHQDSRR